MIHPRHLQQEFAHETGVSLSLLKGERFGQGEFSFRQDPYGLRPGPEFSPDKPLLHSLTHLCIRKAARFSNSLMQLSNAVCLANRYEVPNIVLPHFWYVRPGIQPYGRNARLINLRPGDGFEPRESELALAGRFFYRHTLRRLYPDEPPYEGLKRVVRLFDLDRSKPGLGTESLVIHQRSGDIFQGDGVNAVMGQPPLSYYQKVIRHENPARVSLVFEEDGNPVIAALLEYIQGVGIELECVSGTLRNDIEHLLRARVLVVGRGSFMCGVTALSKQVEKVYFFESGYDDWGKPGIRQVRVSDSRGEYAKQVLSRWKNTAEQRAMMLSYPESALHLAETQ